MTNLNVTPEFLLAGKAIFTVSNGKGQHHTYLVAVSKKNKAHFFVSKLVSPDSYSYMGALNTRKGFWTTPASAFKADSLPAKVFKWALEVIQGGKSLPQGYAIQHEGSCGRCKRPLTDPVSIATGIGPICRKKV